MIYKLLNNIYNARNFSERKKAIKIFQKFLIKIKINYYKKYNVKLFFGTTSDIIKYTLEYYPLTLIKRRDKC